MDVKIKEFAGKKLIIETGEMAKQADGSVLVPEVLQPFMGGIKVLKPIK